MSTLEQKLVEIELKVMKLAEQNIQCKQVCNDLMETHRKLEKTTSQLHKQLQQKEDTITFLREQMSGLRSLQDNDME